MPDSPDEARFLALLDTLVPGTHGFPSASGTGVPARLRQGICEAELSRCALAALDADFCDADAAGRVATVTALERKLGPAFQALLAAVYGAYYTDPAVLADIARRTGYQHPPQPTGYALPAFDATVLDTVRQAAPSWRDPSVDPKGNAP